MNFYSLRQKGNYQGKNLDYNGEPFTGRLSTQIKLPAKFSFQGSYNFRGAQQNVQMKN